MTAAAVLLVYAAAVGFAAPRPLLRGAWPHRAPALAVTAWLALCASFTAAVALAAYRLAVPVEHLHSGPAGVLHWCGFANPPDGSHSSGTARPALALPLTVLLVVLGLFVAEVVRGRRARSRHRQVLDLVGRRAPDLRATVLDVDRPAAYCLPGLRPRIVVSSGALRLLSTAQLDAVLAHERAYITGRHHLLLAASVAFSRVFGPLPLARHAREQIPVLLEMAADDRALRRRPPEALASAMYEMAAGTAPAGAFAMGGGPGTVLRLRRVLTERRRPHAALRGAVVAAAAALPLFPLLLACMHGVG
jgi:Zn-dependent protease with chaperone function